MFNILEIRWASFGSPCWCRGMLQGVPIMCLHAKEQAFEIVMCDDVCRSENSCFPSVKFHHTLSIAVWYEESNNMGSPFKTYLERCPNTCSIPWGWCSTLQYVGQLHSGAKKERLLKREANWPHPPRDFQDFRKINNKCQKKFRKKKKKNACCLAPKKSPRRKHRTKT